MNDGTGTERSSNTPAVVGLVLSILGSIWVVFAWWMILPEVMILAGILLGIIGLMRANKGARFKGVAVLAIALPIIVVLGFFIGRPMLGGGGY